MAKDKTTTIIFKGEDQISPAIKNATNAVAGLSTSFTGVQDSANQTTVQLRNGLLKTADLLRAELQKLSQLKITPEIQLKQQQILGQLKATEAELRKLDKLVVEPKVKFDPLQLNAISQSFGAIAGKLTELKTAAVGAFREIAQAERKLSTITGESKQLIASLRELSAENKFQATTAELANASYEVLSAGFSSTADATKVLDAATKGAVGGFSDVTTVSKATVSALNAYGLSSDEAANTVAKFISVQQSGLITVDQYAQQISKIAPTAAAAGLSLDELNGAIATATAAGVPVESTFSGLRTAIAAILKPSGEAQELAKSLGIEFNATALRTKGLSGILEQLKTTGNDSADTLLKLFGSTEALAAIAPSINAIDKLKANIDASANSASLLDENFNKALDPIKAFQNETTEALAILGEDIVKVFNPVVGGLRAVVAAFRELPEPLQEIIAFVVGGGASIAATGAAISGFLAILTPTLSGLTALAGGVKAAFVLLNVQVTALGAKTAITNAIQATQITLMGGVGTSAGGATVGVGALTVATAKLAVATLAALAPLAALGAAIGLIALVKATAELSDFNKELDATIGNSVDAGNNATRLADRLKNLANERKKGGVVTDEQIKKEKSFLSLADQEIATQKRLLEEAKKLKPADEAQRNSQAALIAGYEISIKQLEGQKKALNESIAASKAKTESNKTVARSEDEIKNAVDRRLKNEQAANEKFARLRSKQFEATTKSDTRTFEREAQTEKRAFEKSLNEEERTFTSEQKADKEQFEKGLLAEQRAFNEGEKEKDRAFQKQRQAQERAFNEQQQLAKAAFDAKQQQASKAFDAKQNAEKEAADSKFAQRRLEIERQLQLEAAKTPEDRAKLEAEFKAADEKAAREKKAFAQLKLEEEAFAAKQKADKEAFDAKQKADQAAFEKAQEAAKIAFDDSLKARDVAFEQQKEAAKLAFEETLKAKRDVLEAGQEAKKLAFEDAQNAKKAAFDDAQQLKKDAFEQSINDKKAAFEEAERTKKAAFEDTLKSLEAQFKKEERDKDIAAAKQVAAIKSSAATSVPSGLNAAIGIGVKPLAKGGRFNQGEQLLVGEKGAELVTFGSSGFVNNATNTKQALAANTATSAMSTARMEALLTQLVGKLDRPNIAVQTSENPSDVLVKVQREIARAAAIGI